MRNPEFDLLVIGGGSGGVRAARVAAGHGARVALVESGDMGGTCVNVGCVPKKLFVYAARFADAQEDSRGFGWSPEPGKFDWARLVANKDTEIARLNGIYETMLAKVGVTLIRGRGTMMGPHSVAAGSKTYTTRQILIATGARPLIPDIPGAELLETSDALFHMTRLPKRMAILGGGYIGVEFACIFARLGVAVTVIHRGSLLLPSAFDQDARQALTEEVRQRGIDVRLATMTTALARAGARAGDHELRLILSDGNELLVDQAVATIGRVPNTAGLGLAGLGVAQRADGGIVVDEAFRTNLPSVYAVGDVVGGEQLTPVALAQGMRLAHNLFGPRPLGPLELGAVPTAVFSTPPLATVGLTEARAREAVDEVVVYRSSFRPMKHSLSGRQTRAMMKLVVDGGTDRILGCHIVGEDAAEIIQGFAVAINCGATKTQLDATIGLHPSAAEELVTMREPVVS